MKIVCAPKGYPFKGKADKLDVILYGRSDRPTRGSAGASIKDHIARLKLHAAPKAWDFLSLALAVTAADLAGHRTKSADGWTREFELEVAVSDPVFWNKQKDLVAHFLGFLTTDKWNLVFINDGFLPKPPKAPVYPDEDCVALLSGGLDSFVGNLDLVSNGKRPFAVSQTVRGDAKKQTLFAKLMNGGLRHLQINHNVKIPNGEKPPSQRGRSLAFLAYGILAATTLKQYHAGKTTTLYVCENGFISINPPLTDMRLGSLSTRTTNPVFLGLIQKLLTAAELKIRIENPYQLKTKGEMLDGCLDKKVIKAYASATTSCGRYLQHGYNHCGRCVPCLVRRAAFLAAGADDKTVYVFNKLGRDDKDHARFDDVRAVAMAVAKVQADGLEAWVGTALSTTILGDVAPLESMVGRGLQELGALLKAHGVK
jgi:hypothetical protein